jgi:hypothetical protein
MAAVVAFIQVLTMYELSSVSFMNSPPQPTFFIPSLSIPGVVSKLVIFTFTYMCSHYLQG